MYFSKLAGTMFMYYVETFQEVNNANAISLVHYLA